MLGIFIALLTIAYIVSKATTNQNPEKSPEEEDKRNEAKVKHQFWQTMDYTEPWGK